MPRNPSKADREKAGGKQVETQKTNDTQIDTRNERKDGSLQQGLASADFLKELSQNLVTPPPSNEYRSSKIYPTLPPSLHAKVAKKCNTQKISMNEAINQLLEAWAGDTQVTRKEIEKYQPKSK